MDLADAGMSHLFPLRNDLGAEPRPARAIADPGADQADRRAAAHTPLEGTKGRQLDRFFLLDQF